MIRRLLIAALAAAGAIIAQATVAHPAASFATPTTTTTTTTTTTQLAIVVPPSTTSPALAAPTTTTTTTTTTTLAPTTSTTDGRPADAPLVALSSDSPYYGSSGTATWSTVAGATSYEWTNNHTGQSGTTTATSITVYFNDCGRYTVTVRAINASGAGPAGTSGAITTTGRPPMGGQPGQQCP